jgi:DNA mismatch endonuclease (patch repair protein)
LHRKDLPGKPDIVLTRFRTIIFVHGCFWHHHSGCSNASLPKTRPDFWDAKLAGNVKRDERNLCQLKQLGWHVLIVWECEISDEIKLKKRLCKFLAHAN